MRLFSAVLIPLGLSAAGLSAVADDQAPLAPPTPTPTPATTDTVPSFTFPAPMGSSAGNGLITGGDAAPVVSGSAPVIQSQPPATGGILWQRSTRSYSSTIDQFQSSSYWSAPQAFNPAAAPNYSSGLANGWGTHVRYPYFKHRAPWTYQGPAAISHTIHW